MLGSRADPRSLELQGREGGHDGKGVVEEAAFELCPAGLRHLPAQICCCWQNLTQRGSGQEDINRLSVSEAAFIVTLQS